MSDEENAGGSSQAVAQPYALQSAMFHQISPPQPLALSLPCFRGVLGILNSNARFGTGTSFARAMIYFSKQVYPK